MQFIIRDNDIDEIIIDIDEVDKKIVEHYYADFKQWLREGPVFFVQNKVPARMEALLKEIVPVLKSENVDIPEDAKQCCAMWFDRPDYMNRRERDEEMVAKRKADHEAIEAEALKEAQARSAIEQAKRIKQQEDIQLLIDQAVQDALTKAIS